MNVSAGHRLVPHSSDCLIEAWGPDRPSCLTEALIALVESFAEVGDACATQVVPLAADPGVAAEELVSLFEDVIYGLDVFSVVPVRFHLAETEDGGVAGDMEVIPVEETVAVGPAPKGVSYHELSMVDGEGGWRCRVLVDA
jgi:SHS2 domain-containing protein